MLDLPPETLARIEEARAAQTASGLSPQEYLAQSLARVDAAHEKVIARKEGWGTPILAGFVLAMAGWIARDMIASKGHLSWAPLITVLGTGIGVYYQFDEDYPPPRHRLLGGLAIGIVLGAAGLIAIARWA
jgi:hypothetical protein